MTLKPSLPDSYVCRVGRDRGGPQFCLQAGGRGLVTDVFTPQCGGLAVASAAELTSRPCQPDTTYDYSCFNCLRASAASRLFGSSWSMRSSCCLAKTRSSALA